MLCASCRMNLRFLVYDSRIQGSGMEMKVDIGCNNGYPTDLKVDPVFTSALVSDVRCYGSHLVLRNTAQDVTVSEKGIVTVDFNLT